MADELSIQQKQPSTTPYVTTGGVLGAVGAGAAAHYYSQPKYGSWEDILKDSKDEATFSGKKYENVEQSVKDEIKAANNAEADAKAKYNKKMNEYVEANKGGKTAELPANDKSLQDLKTAQDNLANKRAELVNKKIAELTAENNKTVDTVSRDNAQKRMQAIIKRVQSEQESQKAVFERINEYIANAGKLDKDGKAVISDLEKAMEAFEKQQKDIDIAKKIVNGEYDIASLEAAIKKETNADKKSALQKKLNALKEIKITYAKGKTKTIPVNKTLSKSEIETFNHYIKLAEDYNSANYLNEVEILKGVKGSKKQIAEEIKTAIINTRSLNEGIDSQKAIVDKAVKQYLEAKKALPTPEQTFAEFRKIASDTEVDFINNNYAKNKNEAVAQMRSAIIAREQAQINSLKEELNELKSFEKIQRLNELIEKDGNVKYKGKLSVKDLLTGKIEIDGKTTKLTLAEQKELAALKEALQNTNIETLTKAENAKNITKRIAELDGKEGEIAKLEEKFNAAKKNRETVRRLDRQLEAFAGKDYKVEVKDGKAQLFKADGKVFEPKAGMNLSGKIVAPEYQWKKEDLKALDEARAQFDPKKLTAEEIKAKAEAAVTDEMLKAEKEAVVKAENAVKEAKSQLPKVEAKDVETLKKEFIAKEGSEAEYVKKETDAVMKALKEKHGNLVNETRMKFFESGKNWKIATAAAAGAVVLGAIGKLFAPKKEA